MTGLLFLFLFSNYGLSVLFFIYAIFFSSLMVVTFIDFDYKEIPDVISLPGIVLGFILSILYPALQGSVARMPAMWSSLAGILVGGGSIYLIGVLGSFVFKKEAMGGGDVKLLAMMGAFLGWKLALLTFFIAPFFGAVVGIIVKIRTGESLIPYGPFLSLAGFVALFWGDNILQLIYF